MLTDSYFTKNPNISSLKLVCQLIDVRCGPTNDDIDMINYMIDYDVPFVVVATKSDKLSKTALSARIKEIKEEFFSKTDISIIPFSSINREGKDVLGSEILKITRL